MGTGIGATAYTSAAVTRDATIGVKTDSTALITLTASATFSQITEDGTGQLAINFTSLNGDSEFVFGDTSAPGTTNAFSLSPSESRDVTLAYSLNSTDPAASNPNVQFDVYTDDGTTVTSVATASEEASGTITGATAGTTYYVVLTLDTTNVDTSTTDLSGTLTITA